MDPIEQLDKKLDQILEGQSDTEERLKTIEGDKAAHLKLIKEHAEETGQKIASVEETLEDIQKRVTSERMGFHGDNLLGAMPDDLKKWIPYVQALGKSLPAANSYSLGGRLTMERSAGALDLAHRDAAQYVAVGGWFQARLKASISLFKGNQAASNKWNERAELLSKALGGTFLSVEKASLQEDTDAEGGFLVPTIVESMLAWLRKDASVVRQSGPTILQMRSNVHQLPNLANDFSVSWVDEEGVISDSAPATPFGQGTLTAKKQAGLVTISLELIQDNIINLLDFLLTHLMNQSGRADDIQALEGDGTVFTGLGSASGIVEKQGGGDTISLAEYMALVYGQEEGITIGNGSVIYTHPWAVRDLLQIETTSGALAFPFLAQNQGIVTNVIVPIFKTAAISRTRDDSGQAANDETRLYHGNPRGIVIGDRMGSEFVVNPWSETEFKKGQVSVRLLMRTGILIWIPGYFTKLTGVAVAA